MDYEARRTPLHTSLHEVRLIAGAPRNAAVGVWTAVLIILYGGVSAGLGIWAFAAIPAGMALHKLLALWTKNDPLRPVIYARAYSREKNHYTPWPSAVINRRSRPDGFGRGMLR
jgi:type IV secretory pathway TrbD component